MEKLEKRKKRSAVLALFTALLLGTATLYGAYTLPSQVSKKTTSSFGECRNSNDLAYTRFHAGIDLSTNGFENTNIYATEEGYLWKIWVNHENYGNAIYIMHADGIASVYGHLNRFSDRFLPVIQSAMIEFGEATYMEIAFSPQEYTIRRGEIIGLSGQTGTALAPHCHFEFFDVRNDEYINPILYLKDLLEPPAADLKIERVRIDGENQNVVENGTFYFSSAIPKIEINTRLSNRTGQGKYGVKTITFFVNEAEFYKIHFDRIPREMLENGDTVFGEGSNHSNYWYKLYASLEEKPIVVNLWKDLSTFPDLAACRIIVEDDWGNLKTWNFRLRRR
ncbi:MAG: M23 family metallopeptidase [Thermotogaceae bacterium]|jgi:hypothetical protein|nr:M23 family metallopeptidase [Thermotogota bacterium]NLZ14613.1 M23 family metallopeptidase [Thermotogaceae bacterium]MDD8040799.1 M23 family metallopeptidase [Thermotogota bacterium]HOZ11500.1 M23 family metallopeptidase [Thermotogota bacterium]HPB86655.1 M23 family metallopeptidase [Thermotogota bacterium]